MNIYLFDENRVITFNLPYKKIGNFWLTDDDNKNIINIKGENNNWIISGSETTKIISGFIFNSFTAVVSPSFVACNIFISSILASSIIPTL